MQELKRVRKQLVLDLDKNEAPAAWRWRVDCFVKFDDGAEQIMPREIPATAEEVSQHIGAAVLKQASDIEADRMDKEAKLAAAQAAAAASVKDVTAKAAADIAALNVRLETANNLTASLTQRLQAAEDKLDRIAQADAQYDASVKPLLTPAETRQ